MTKTTKVPFKCPVCEGKGCKTCNNTGIVWGDQVETEASGLDNATQDWTLEKMGAFGPVFRVSSPVHPYFYPITKPLCNPFQNPYDIWY